MSHRGQAVARLFPGLFHWSGTISVTAGDIPRRELADAVLIAWYMTVRSYFESLPAGPA
ncbi:MAG: hypothetical protein AB1449_14780 [Chloroflexota bacterium]